ncbi:MAG: sirohydrochlorin chelatase [Thiohalomonadales bacterium]
MNKPALLIIGHGSRDNDAVTEFKQLVTAFRLAYPERLCDYGFLEFARPLIVDGLNGLIAQGAKKVTAIPAMLMAAGHVKNDIPSEVNNLQADYPEVEIQYGTDLGIHANLLQAARERIESVESQFGADYNRKSTLLMVVGRGTSDADANSNISKVTRMLGEGMGFGWAETSYSGVTTPLVHDALKTVKGLGFKRIIVFPYFLFTGRLVKRIYQHCDEFQQTHADIQLIKAPYLNDHALVLKTFYQRLEETEAGTGNMNCQLCQYREQIIGAEHKVGMAQQGHHHHVRGIGTDHDHQHDHHHQSGESALEQEP